ncbi:hypothetical protein LZ30DRAFT_785122 [Colletotrichum cereale]|nr:hypothetical protein LZ30DRAFT_785122 [Colletotrichum cereale]
MNRARARMMNDSGTYQNRTEAVKESPLIVQGLGKIQKIDRTLAAQYDEQTKLADKELGLGLKSGEVAGQNLAIYNKLN